MNKICRRKYIYITTLLIFMLFFVLFYQHVTNNLKSDVDNEYRHTIYELHNLMKKVWKDPDVSNLEFLSLVSELEAIGEFTSYYKNEVSLVNYTESLRLYVVNCIISPDICKELNKSKLSNIFLELYHDPANQIALNKLLFEIRVRQ